MHVRRICAFAAVVSFLGGCAGALNFSSGHPPSKHPAHRPSSYRVHRGDSLYSIAWHYDLNYQAVARWNGIDPPYTIHPGERIYLYPHNHAPRSSKSRKTAMPVVAKAPAHRASDKNSAAGNTMLRWQWPASGKALASFGKQGLAGKGIVITGKLGEAVRAAANGTVVYAGDALVGYGRLIIIKHNDEWLSAYGHNQRLLVQEGKEVKAGEQIATMGVAPDGKPALYFEIRRDGIPVNPLRFLPGKR